jgi:hypothetical protein
LWYGKHRRHDDLKDGKTENFFPLSREWCDARPHPGLLPQEKEKRSQRLGVGIRQMVYGQRTYVSVVAVRLSAVAFKEVMVIGTREKSARGLAQSKTLARWR